MRFVKLLPAEGTSDMEELYGRFDLGLDGRPNGLWEARNLKMWRPPEMLQCVFFPDCFVARVRVNRRMIEPLARAYLEISARWTAEVRKAHGLNQYVKCYCFGDGYAPNLHWYGAAWELSPGLSGEMLSEAGKIFTRNGFSVARAGGKEKSRTLEYW